MVQSSAATRRHSFGPHYKTVRHPRTGISKRRMDHRSSHPCRRSFSARSPCRPGSPSSDMSKPLALLRRACCSALRRRDGAVSVEFAIAAIPLLFMLFAIIESGLIFVAQVDLSNATMMVARQIRTGSLMAAGKTSITSGSNLSLSDFKTAICNTMNFIPTASCTSQLQIDMRTQSSFGAGQTASSPIASYNFNNSSLCYYSGQSGSIVELRAFYLWKVNTPMLFSALVNASSYTVDGTTTSGSYHVITAAEAFRVEQNSSGSNAGSTC